MTRRDIAQKLLEALPDEFFPKQSAQLCFDFVPPLSQGIYKADKYVKIVIRSIKHMLMQGENIEIAGFGKFIIRQKKERMGRNPATGEAAVINARKVVSFKPSRKFKKMVNGGK